MILHHIYITVIFFHLMEKRSILHMCSEKRKEVDFFTLASVEKTGSFLHCCRQPWRKQLFSPRGCTHRVFGEKNNIQHTSCKWAVFSSPLESFWLLSIFFLKALSASKKISRAAKSSLEVKRKHLIFLSSVEIINLTLLSTTIIYLSIYYI